MKKEWYGKIFCEEGVVAERVFASEEEALAYVQAFYDTLDVVDHEDADFYQAAVGTEPAKDEP